MGITVFATSISAILVPMMNRRMQRLLAPREEKMKHVGQLLAMALSGENSGNQDPMDRFLHVR